MPKSNDIVGTIRIPEAGYGRFWNFMKTMPGGEFTPQLQAEAPNSKRTKGKDSEGSSGKCLALTALLSHGPCSTSELSAHMVKLGKSKHVGSLLNRMLDDKLVVKTTKGYAVTKHGKVFAKTNCNI